MTRLYCLSILPIAAIIAVSLAVVILAIVAVHITIEYCERFAVFCYRMMARAVIALSSRI